MRETEVTFGPRRKRRSFHAGDAVRVIRGPLVGLTGRVQRSHNERCVFTVTDMENGVFFIVPALVLELVKEEATITDGGH